MKCQGCNVTFEAVDEIELCHYCYCNEAQDKTSPLHLLLGV